MKQKLFNLTILLLVGFSFLGCQNTIVENKTIENAVTSHYQLMQNWTDGPTTDQKAFIEYNRAEILKTLEIAETVEIKEKDLAIAFTRFSIGTTVVRQSIWFRRIKDNWTQILVTPSEYSYEHLGFAKKTDELKEIFDKIEKWEEDNPKVWWLKYM